MWNLKRLFWILTALWLAALPSWAQDAVHQRFDFKLNLSAGVMTGEWTHFDPPRTGSAPLVAEAILGIPNDEIAEDLWAIAARGTYRPTKRSSLVLQLSQRRFADSPLTDAEDAVDLDWLYYAHDLGDSTTIRVGRTPVLFGLLNESRDEGVDLPFFRVPFAFYREGGFVTETIDGLRLRHVFDSWKRWALTLEVYAGAWELLETAGAVNRLAGVVPETATRVDTVDADGYGGSFWLGGPAKLRLGFGAQRFDTEGGVASRLTGQETEWEQEFISFQVGSERFTLRAEFRQVAFPAVFTTAAIGLEDGVPGAGFITDIETGAWYVQADLRLFRRWSLHFQTQRGGDFHQCSREILELRCERLDPNQILSFAKPHGERTWVDEALSLRYELRENLVLRAELHRTDGVALRRDQAGPFLALTREDPVDTGHYGILSIAWRW